MAPKSGEIARWKHGSIYIVRYGFDDIDGSMSWIDIWEDENGKEVDKETAKRETLRLWHNDNIRVLQLHKERLEAKIASLEADIRLSRERAEAIPKYQPKAEVGIPVQPMQEVVASERSFSRPHPPSRHVEIFSGPASIRSELVLRDRQSASTVHHLPSTQN